jgi:hypothetical protein
MKRSGRYRIPNTTYSFPSLRRSATIRSSTCTPASVFLTTSERQRITSGLAPFGVSDRCCATVDFPVPGHPPTSTSTGRCAAGERNERATRQSINALYTSVWSSCVAHQLQSCHADVSIVLCNMPKIPPKNI